MHKFLFFFISFGGFCRAYQSGSTLCDGNIGENVSVYISENVASQSELTSRLNTLINVTFDRTSNLCQELIQNVLCLYYYPPCGFNGTFTAPVSICPEECFYVQHKCLKLWNYLEISLLESEFGFIDCSSPGQRLDSLPHCCVDAGITMDILTSTPGQTQLQYVHRLQNLHVKSRSCI